METLTNIKEEEDTNLELSLANVQAMKIKIQGFLYEERENIFKKDFIPTLAESYTSEELTNLPELMEKYIEICNDSIGILIATHIELNDKKCIACKRCTRYCPTNALEKIGPDLVFHAEQCIKCGNCVGNCQFYALKAVEKGLGIYIKNPLTPKPHILPKYYKTYEIEAVIIKIFDFYKSNRNCDEALWQVIQNVGFNTLLNYLN